MERGDLDLSYLNARIRAWKGELFDKDEYDTLIRLADIESLITHLKDTVYARDIEIAASRYKNEAEVLDGGLRGSLVNTFNRLWSYTPASARTMLQAILSIWEVYNLKAILRARDKGIPPDESISILIPAGEMDETALKELNQQKSIKDILNLLSTWGSPYARPIKAVIKQYMQERRLILIELSLDRFLHEHCLSTVVGNDLNRRIIKHLVKVRIDYINVSTLLKLSGELLHPASANSYFLEGGDIIGRDDFLRLAASKNKKELMQGLIDSIKDRHWKKAIGSIDYDEAFFLEERLEELTKEETCRLSIIEPLSIAVAVCFIYEKIREIKNLRLIVRAKIFNIPAVEVKRFIL